VDLKEDRKERTPDILGKGVGKEIRRVSQSSDARCPSIISSTEKEKMRQFEEKKRNHWLSMFTEDRRRRVATRKIYSSFWSLYLESVFVAIPKNIGQCFVNKARLMIATLTLVLVSLGSRFYR